MVSVPRILRDYQDAGSVNSLLAVWGFVDDHAFLTKAGHVGLVYRVGGSDYECLDPIQRRDIVHRFEAALRLTDTSAQDRVRELVLQAYAEYEDETASEAAS